MNVSLVEENRVKAVLGLEAAKLSEEEARKTFFKTLAFPLQSVCG